MENVSIWWRHHAFLRACRAEIIFLNALFILLLPSTGIAWHIAHEIGSRFFYRYHSVAVILVSSDTWVGMGSFSKMLATFNHVGGSFNRFMLHRRDVWTHFMCHHELWPTSLSHPISFFLNSNLVLVAGKHYSIQVDFLILFFCRYLFSLLFFWLVCYCSMWLYFSHWLSDIIIENWCRVDVSNEKLT